MVGPTPGGIGTKAPGPGAGVAIHVPDIKIVTQRRNSAVVGWELPNNYRAIQPERFDLPRLRGLLSRQKKDDVLRESKELAVRRR